jgi:hypothetical protein
MPSPMVAPRSRPCSESPAWKMTGCPRARAADVVAFLASPRSVAINGDAIAAGGGAPGAIHY